MTGLLVRFKHNHPKLWEIVERINGAFVRIRYPKLSHTATHRLSSIRHSQFKWSLVSLDDIPALSEFLSHIPNEQLKYFNPHSFDKDTLTAMLLSGSFLMIKVTDDDRIIGYHFLRCFFIGKAFHGLIVDPDFGGKGIGTRMWKLASEICHDSRLKMFATISESNMPSLTSCQKGCNTTIVEHLPDNYLLLACHPPLSDRET